VCTREGERVAGDLVQLDNIFVVERVENGKFSRVSQHILNVYAPVFKSQNMRTSQ
jgi:hypothetical protein